MCEEVASGGEVMSQSDIIQQEVDGVPNSDVHEQPFPLLSDTIPDSGGKASSTFENAENVRSETQGRGSRDKFPSVKLYDRVTHTVTQKSPSQSSSKPMLSSGNPFPIAHYVYCDRFSVFHRIFFAAVTIGRKPTSLTEAMKDAGWREAMQKKKCSGRKWYMDYGVSPSRKENTW